MNDTSKQLLESAEAELGPNSAARRVTAAVLRKLSDLMVEGGWEDGNEWPDPDDLTMLADDIAGVES